MVCVNRPLTRQGNGMVCANRPLRCPYISISAVNLELEYIPLIDHLSASESFRVEENGFYL
jgi:hypothetical protein